MSLNNVNFCVNTPSLIIFLVLRILYNPLNGLYPLGNSKNDPSAGASIGVRIPKNTRISDSPSAIEPLDRINSLTLAGLRV